MGIGTSVMPFLPDTRLGYHITDRLGIEGGGGMYTFTFKSSSPSWIDTAMKDVTQFSGRMILFNLPIRIKPLSSDKAFLSIDVGPRIVLIRGTFIDSSASICDYYYYKPCYEVTGTEVDAKIYGAILGIGIEYFLTPNISLYIGASSSYTAIKVGGKWIDKIYWLYSKEVEDNSQNFDPSNLNILSFGNSNLNLSFNIHLK